MGWQDRKQSNVAQDEPGLAYPFVQWINNGKDVDPRQATGGWFMPEESLNLFDAMPVGAEAAEMNFSTGDTSIGVFAQALTIAPLQSRFAWARTENDREVLSRSYVEGARGKLQVLGYVLTERGYKGPIFITVKGTVSGDVIEALKAHRERVRLATKGAPSPYFGMVLQAGEPVRRGKKGQQSLVTPITLDEDFDPDAAYVGDMIADEIEARWDEFKEWQGKWADGLSGAADSEPDFGPEADENSAPVTRSTGPARKPTTPPVDAEIGAARERWADAWNALKKAGITTAFLNPDFKAPQINEVADAMEAALTQLQNGVHPESVGSVLAIQLADIAGSR